MIRQVIWCAQLVVALSIVVVGAAVGQVPIQGVVVDAETGEPLPAANVQIADTYRGTISNADGRFSLEARPPVTLIIRYIGYASVSLRVETGQTSRDLVVRMAPVAIEMENIVVTDENPAINIMREVIRRKQEWRADLETYEVEAYNRFTLSNDTGIVSIIETLTDAYWDDDDGIREVVRSKRQTANLDLPAAMPAAMLVANLYDDDVEVAGHRIRGVTHPEALTHYRFTLEGTRVRDEEVVYDIGVRPRTRQRSGFVGRVSVLAEAHAIIDVELRPGDAFLFPPPIKAMDVTYRQQFDNFGGEYWLPVDFRSTFGFEVGFGALLAFPRIQFEQVSRFSGYEVNVTIPDSLYARDESVTVDEASVAADTLLDNEGIGVPLTEVERIAYAEIDSSLTLDQAFKPTGALSRFARMSMNLSNDSRAGARDSSGARRLRIDPGFAPALWYNRVDAVHIGGRATLDVGRALRLSTTLGYNTGPERSRDRWVYSAGARVTLDPPRTVGRPATWLEIAYGRQNLPRYTSGRYGRFVNSVYVLLGGLDYFDYYQSEGFSGQVGVDLESAPVAASLHYAAQTHRSLSLSTSYDIAGARPLRGNAMVDNGTMRSVALEVRLGEDGDGTRAEIVSHRSIVLRAERSDPSLGSDFEYTHSSVSGDWALPTFYRRRLLPNTLHLHLVAGTTNGTLPTQRRGIVDVSMSYYKPFGVLHTNALLPYEGDEYVGFFWEHNFRTIPFELLGMRSAARNGYSVLVFGGHASASYGGGATPATSGVSGRISGHHELGVSLSGILGVLRLDVAARLDRPGYAVGFGFARLF